MTAVLQSMSACVVAVANGTHVVAVDGSHELEAGEPAVHMREEDFLEGRRGAIDEG